MHERTIREKLRQKHEQFLKLFKDDPGLQKELATGTIITGGCITSMLLDEDVNDYDLYFRTRELANRVAIHFAKKIPKPVDVVNLYAGNYRHNDRTYRNMGYEEEIYESYRQIVEQLPGDRVFLYIPDKGIYNARKSTTKEIKKGEVVFISPNAISLAGGWQLITRFFGEPDDIHENFDFDHCKCYWKSWDRELVLPQKSLLSITTKELRYNGSLYPVTSILRTRKFIKRGWNLNAAQYVKMCMQVSDLYLNHLPTLVDQLMGVDIVYLMDFVHAMESTSDELIESDTVCKLIDEVFDRDDIYTHDGYGEDENE